MRDGLWGQQDYAVRLEWGLAGAKRIVDPTGALVLVDVLSFSTTVCLAVSRGTAVYPSAWDAADSHHFAEQVKAELAVGRRQVNELHPWSLSPASIVDAPTPERLVLPSPNGATIALSVGDVGQASAVVAACLRNAAAVATWLVANHFGSLQRPISVIAAGERWPDGSLRPALEDYLAAGSVLHGIAQAAPSGAGTWSPEARAALATYLGTADVAVAIRESGSGQELLSTGFGRDVELAIAQGADNTVPRLVDGAFIAAG